MGFIFPQNFIFPRIVQDPKVCMDREIYINEICSSWIYSTLLQNPNPKVSYYNGFPIYAAKYNRKELVCTLDWRERHLNESKASDVTRWIENFLYENGYMYVREFPFPLDNLPLWKKYGNKKISDCIFVDYFIPTLRLVIEVDMDEHHEMIFDRARDNFLSAEYGVRGIIRIKSKDELDPKIKKTISGYQGNQKPIDFSVNNANTWIVDYWEQLWFIVEYEKRFGMPIGPDIRFGGKHKISYSEIHQIMNGWRTGYFMKPGPWEKVLNKEGKLVDSYETQFASKLIYIFEVLLGQNLSILESKDTSKP